MRPEPTDDREITFEPVGESHWALLSGWLAAPHIREWWGDPDEELSLIRSLPDGDGTEGFVALSAGEPVGFIQCWRPARFEDTHWLAQAPWLRDLPADTVGVDMFIGSAGRIGVGLGPKILRAFAARLFAQGAPRLIIDPDQANTRAVRAYAKAGFRPFGIWAGAEETTVLMELFPAFLPMSAGNAP